MATNQDITALPAGQIINIDTSLLAQAQKPNGMTVQPMNEPLVPTSMELVASESASILAAVARASTDPNVDVEKMQALNNIRKEIMAEQRMAAFNADLAEMQAQLPSIQRTGEIKINEKVQSRYAKFEDINEAALPVMRQYGFALTFRISYDQGGILITGVLTHRAGHREDTTIRLPYDTSGNKNSVQAVGSSISYGKRYVMCSLLNITAGGEDDDGQQGGRASDLGNGTGPNNNKAKTGIVYITKDQRDIIIDKLDKAGKTASDLCHSLKINNITEIQSTWFQQVITRIEAGIKQDA